VETARAPLKTTLPLAGLHGNTGPGVRKGLTGFARVSNLVRRVLGQSARRPHLEGERISCVDALRGLSAPRTGMPLVALRGVPVRRHRGAPRVKKRRPKSVPFLINPRQELRQPLVQTELRG
jgi:hypothetical protein